MKTMKDLMLVSAMLLLFTLNGCIGTDEVEDTINSITIVPPEDVTIVNDGNFAKLLGDETLLEVRASSDLGGEFIVSSEDIVWSTDNSAVATVDESGMVRAVGLGNTTLLAVFEPANSASVTDQISISVAGDAEAIALLDISSQDNLLVINPEDQLQLNGVPLNAGGVEVPSTETLEWVSSDTAIAIVDQTGLVTARSGGEVRITATLDEISGFIDLIVDSGEGENSTLSRTAEFMGLAGYRTSGDAVLLTNDDGSLTLRLEENFSAQNGPGLYMYLSNAASSITGGVELGELQSTSGEQEYEVPGNVTLDQFNHIVLYCKPFGVGFGTAPLSE